MRKIYFVSMACTAGVLSSCATEVGNSSPTETSGLQKMGGPNVNTTQFTCEGTRTLTEGTAAYLLEGRIELSRCADKESASGCPATMTAMGRHSRDDRSAAPFDCQATLELNSQGYPTISRYQCSFAPPACWHAGHEGQGLVFVYDPQSQNASIFKQNRDFDRLADLTNCSYQNNRIGLRRDLSENLVCP